MPTDSAVERTTNQCLLAGIDVIDQHTQVGLSKHGGASIYERSFVEMIAEDLAIVPSQ
ncbi:hypothetical protein N9B17_08030 [Rhodopirellula sp.]|nr:hypothetical protein [Rhodopirellula sp.]